MAKQIKIKDHFFHPEYISVFDLDQIYMTSSMYYETGFKNVWATFDLLVRDMPIHRNFMVFTGLEEMILGIKNWHFENKNINLLLKNKLISLKFSQYLTNFKFTGDMYAMPEGTFFFPGEPVVRITAPIIEGNLFTAFLTTSLTSNTIYSSKYIRSYIAAHPRKVIGVSPQRATSFESSFKAQRSSFITGSFNCPSPIVRNVFDMPMGDNATIAYHAFISSYATEKQAMEIAAKYAEVDLSIMIDTYDIKEGLKNAISIAKNFTKKKGKKLKIVIDSGDLLQLSKYVRKELDKAGLKKVGITLASNLDEYKIKDLMKNDMPADTFIVNTEAVTSSDSPKMEAVYKISEIIKGKEIDYKMKLSKNKVSLPGKKQIYRVKKGKYYDYDILGLDDEKIGKPLLRKIFEKGKLVYKLPPTQSIRNSVIKQLDCLPRKYLEIDKDYKYPVKHSSGLQKLTKQVKSDILKQYK